MQPRFLIALITVLATLNVPTVAEASEVVKLARLVLTGKRASPEPHREPAPAPTDKQPTTAPAAEPGSVSTVEAPTSNLAAGASAGSSQNQTFLRPF